MGADLEIRVQPIVPGNPPVAIIEDFAEDPSALRKQAIMSPFRPAREHYPGLRAELPRQYWVTQQPIISRVLKRVYGLAGAVELIDASFSMVTSTPAELSILQRIPHCDAFSNRQFALIHYLTPDCSNGTAFFRHRSTGLQTLDEGQRDRFFDCLEAEFEEHGTPPAAYIFGDSPLFEQVVAIDARFNRAIIYPGNALHSGVIPPGARLSTDPADGRLTITAFFTVG